MSKIRSIRASRMARLVRRISIAILATLLASACGGGTQQPAAPQGYQAPRAADGHPDLQGVWQAVNTAVWNIQDHPGELGIPAGQGVVEGNDIPYLPDALARRDENRKNRLTADPESKCWMVGVPRITYMPYPFEIVQTPRQVTMLYEYVHTVRNLYLDSQHPEGEVGEIEWFMGDSRAKWEGETLVVDVTHFTGQTWFDRSGNYHSNAMHAVERYTRTGPDHMQYEVTIEDPNVFAKPWKMSMPLYRRLEPNVRVLEYECQAYLEQQKDANR